LVNDYKIPLDRICLIQNFVNTEEFEFSNRNFSRRPLRIVFLSRLHSEKGAHVLIDAVKKLIQRDLQDVSVKIYGDGPYRRDLEKIIAEFHLPAVRIKGRVDREDVSSALHSGEIFVFPSLRQEGMPLSLLEAMSSGLICIASDVRGPNDIIQHGVNGYLFEPGNSEILRKLLLKVCREENSLVLTQSARSQIMKDHNRETQLGKLAALLAGGKQ
jgi:colanic acid/amylovoran biosynthesis glycosyltransferase